MKLSPAEFSVMYIAHHTGKDLKEVLSMSQSEYICWCEYFSILNGNSEEKDPMEVDKKEIMENNFMVGLLAKIPKEDSDDN